MLHLHMLVRQFSWSKILILELGQNPNFWQHWCPLWLTRQEIPSIRSQNCNAKLTGPFLSWNQLIIIIAIAPLATYTGTNGLQNYKDQSLRCNECSQVLIAICSHSSLH